MITLVFAWILHDAAHATQRQIQLPLIEASTETTVPVDISAPSIPCDQISARLDDYNKIARQHDLSVATFLNEVTGKLSQWHQALSPLEGAQQTLPIGVFAPIQDGSDKITQVADLAWENSALLANEMDRIQTSLAECVLSAK